MGCSSTLRLALCYSEWLGALPPLHHVHLPTELSHSHNGVLDCHTKLTILSCPPGLGLPFFPVCFKVWSKQLSLPLSGCTLGQSGTTGSFCWASMGCSGLFLGRPSSCRVWNFKQKENWNSKHSGCLTWCCTGNWTHMSCISSPDSLLRWVPPVPLWPSTCSFQGSKSLWVSPVWLVGAPLASLTGPTRSAGMLLAAPLTGACWSPGHLFMMSTVAHLSTREESILLNHGGDAALTCASQARVTVDKVSCLPAHSRLWSLISQGLLRRNPCCS